ncbi:unnamed protein product [Thelazia callipaeda]|uniref:HTH cro/C1-type domain-containing protein n=1 Tax=Thelazia callipaeda TaxID=103827 RepID=A0A0N5CNG8_THECL|nr:unnamed protein product [Thelazia callipaeda]
MFRELNRIRKEYYVCDHERRDLRLQLVMLRGELGLAQCQLAELMSAHRCNKQRIRSSAVPDVNYRSFAFTKHKKMKTVSYFHFKKIGFSIQ